MLQPLRFRRFLFCIPVLLALPAAAQDFLSEPLNPSAAHAFWTAERFQSAEPPAWKFQAPAAPEPAIEDRSGESREWPGSEPQVGALPYLSTRLFQPVSGNAAAAPPPRSLLSKDAGTSKAQFSSSRLIPLDADQSYPYRTVGKLFFETPGGLRTCSAAVIARRLVLTAGQCVHSGTVFPGFYGNFVFVPAFRDGNAPFGLWAAEVVFVTTTWATGGGTFPNPSDFAILEMEDIRSGGQLHRIGDVVGWLGHLTNALRQNHVHILGYAGNLDGGNKMHQVAAGIKKFTAATNTSTAGSDMMQGSGGGPWVQNFGQVANGQQLAGGNTRINRVVGVTSFGPLTKGPKFAGSSLPDVRFSNLFNVACANRPGNC